MNRLLAAACGVPLVLAAAEVRAGPVNVTVTPAPGAGDQFVQLAGVDKATLEGQIRSELEKAFQVLDAGEFLQNFGDAQAFTTKGLGADYASDLTIGEIGFAANFSLNVEKGYVPRDTSTPPPVKGAGVNMTLMGGLNLGLIGMKPLTLFVNWFQSKGSFGQGDTLDGSLRTIGAHAQVRLFRPEGSMLLGLVRWGGFAITTGIDLSRFEVTAGSKPIITEIPVGPGGQGRVTMTSTGTYSLALESITVPLELTTSLRLLYIATLYGGLGFDWQLGGRHEMTIGLMGDMTGSAPAAGIKDVALGTASVMAAEEGKPSAGRLRGIAGVQLNLSVVRIFVQANVMPGAPTLAGVALGARLAF